MSLQIPPQFVSMIVKGVNTMCHAKNKLVLVIGLLKFVTIPQYFNQIIMEIGPVMFVKTIGSILQTSRMFIPLDEIFTPNISLTLSNISGVSPDKLPENANNQLKELMQTFLSLNFQKDGQTYQIMQLLDDQTKQICQMIMSQ